jgi:hypothetical protein
MSVENAVAFLKLAERERGLRQEMAGLKGRTAIDGLVHLGAGLGLVFTAEDYRGAVSAMANGELDESALTAVLEEVGLGKDNPYRPKP